MNGNYVVLILGVLALGYAVYFTHTVLRRRVASNGAGVPRTFEVGATERNQVIEEVRAAGESRALSRTRLDHDIVGAGATFSGALTLRSSRCLWVDHDPDAIVHERRMAELLRVEIDIARTTNQALQFLVGRRYDFIITDLTRPIASGGMDDRAGIKLLKMLAGSPTVPPVIVYADDVGGGDDTADREAPDPAGLGAPTSSTTGSPSDSATETDTESDAASTTESDGAAPVADPRLDDARAAGARAAATTPAALLRSIIDIVSAG